MKEPYYTNLEYDNIRPSCNSDSDCTPQDPHDMSRSDKDYYYRKQCNHKFCDQVKKDVVGRQYGSFCNAFLGNRDCGKMEMENSLHVK